MAEPQPDPRDASLLRSLPEQIAEACGRMIVEGRLRPGQRLTEMELADRFGTSRGPVRDALRLLERRRMVEVLPRRGAFVRPLSLDMIADLFNVRMALAGLAVRTLAERPDPGWLDTFRRRVEELEAGISDAEPEAFAYTLTRAVRAIVRGSHNELVEQIFRDLDEQTFWTTIWRQPLDGVTPKSRRARVAALRETLEAIEAGDPDAAEWALRRLLSAARDSALTVLAQQAPGVFEPAGATAQDRD
jgi:DNA-binding GntR family transcriptional regulator